MVPQGGRGAGLRGLGSNPRQVLMRKAAQLANRVDEQARVVADGVVTWLSLRSTATLSLLFAVLLLFILGNGLLAAHSLQNIFSHEQEVSRGDGHNPRHLPLDG